jgi:hypothetical protein
MALFKHKLTGEIVDAPAHYANNPILGRNLIPVDAEVSSKEETKQKKEAPAALLKVFKSDAKKGETLITDINEEK